MNIKELRIGNLINYEACTCQIMAINTLNKDRLNVKAVNHEWGVELCLVEEVTPLEITLNFLKKTVLKYLIRHSLNYGSSLSAVTGIYGITPG